jgi:hypothetical protein
VLHEHQNQYVCPVLTHQIMKTLAQPVSQLAFICKIMKKKWFLQIFAEKN